MGVMSCSRRCCNNIMCDTYIQSIGYVCNDCQKEFEEWLDDFETTYPKTENEIVKFLKVFMETERSGYDKKNTISIGEFFRQNTR